MNAFVLAGGQSTRMGRDKALLEVDGKTLAARAVGLLRSLGYEPRICGSRPDLAALAEVIPDRSAPCGPLAGIEAALTVSGCDLNLFLPVDMPWMPAAFLEWMAARAEASGAAATIPRYGERPQPLCAVYSRRLLAGLRDSLATGRFKMMLAVGDSAKALGASVDLFQVEAVASALPAGVWPEQPPLSDWFHNLNTPADYPFPGLAVASMPAAAMRHPIS